MPARPSEIHYLPDTADFARRVARKAGLPARAVATRRFPDRESLVQVAAPVARSVVLTAQLHDPDPKLIRVLLAADALRRNGAERVRLLVPYLPYMRQDAAFEPGQAVAQRVFTRTLGRSFDEIITLEPHLHRARSLTFGGRCRARTLSAAPVLAEWCRRRRGRVVLVGPDEESRRWVRAVARRASFAFVVGRKIRLGDRRVRIEFPETVQADRAILLDDIASSGATLAAAARALHRRGIDHVEAAVVHAIFAPGASRRIRAAGIERIASCDTVPHVSNAIRTAGIFGPAVLARGGARRG